MFTKQTKKKSHILVLIVLTLLLTICILLNSCTLPLLRPTNTYLYTHFINVGYGDCTLLTFPNKKNILIDCGSQETSPSVVKFLKLRKVKKLHLIIITHFHPDHSGGLESILANFKVDKILINQPPSLDLCKSCVVPNILKNEAKINYKVVKAGYQIELSPKIDDLIFKVIHPERLNDDPNYSSLVLMLKYKEIKILFAGDVTPEGRLELIKLYPGELKCDILKIPHHGKTYCLEFAKATSPRVAILSLGEHIYNNPSQEEIKGYAQIGASLLRTDKIGNICIKTDGLNFWINTEE